MIMVGVRRFMAREYEHIRRFLSHKDPNHMLALKQEQRAYPPPEIRKRP
jgi:hypothetical protein